LRKFDGRSGVNSPRFFDRLQDELLHGREISEASSLGLADHPRVSTMSCVAPAGKSAINAPFLVHSQIRPTPLPKTPQRTAELQRPASFWPRRQSTLITRLACEYRHGHSAIGDFPDIVSGISLSRVFTLSSVEHSDAGQWRALFT
jgi:hypothetical protein